MDDYKKLKADYDRMSAAAQQKIIAEHVATRDAEIARLKAEVSEARRHAVGVMAAGFNRALDEAGAPAAESPGLRVYAMRDEIAALKDRAEKAAAARDLLRDCNEAMREPMAALRAAVGMPAEGEGAVVAKVLRERTEALAVCARKDREIARLKHTNEALEHVLRQYEKRHGVDGLIKGHIEAATIDQRHEVGMMLVDLAALRTDLAAHKRALAAGPAALHYRSCDCCSIVERAQAEAMKEGT